MATTLGDMNFHANEALKSAKPAIAKMRDDEADLKSRLETKQIQLKNAEKTALATAQLVATTCDLTVEEILRGVGLEITPPSAPKLTRQTIHD